MKKLFAILLVQIVWGGVVVNAYTPCDSTPANCSRNLLNPIFTSIDSANCTGMGCTSSNSQRYYGISADASNGYHNVTYAYDISDNGDTCGSANDCDEDYNSNLYMYVYFPKHNYTYTSESCNGKLPCMVLFHAGGYSDCSGIDVGENVKIVAREYARRGFVCYVVEYRRGKIEDPGHYLSTTIGYTSAQKLLAFDRAITDGRGAIRNIIYRELHESTYNDPYRVDLSKIFLGGMSAGAGIAIASAYYEYQGGTYDQLNAILPGISNSNVLGSINQVYYDCNTCGFNYFNNTSNVKVVGIMGCWGVALLPNNILDAEDAAYFFSHNHNIPAFIGWCGYQDLVAHPEQWDDRFSPTSGTPDYNAESSCLLSDPYTFSLSPSMTGTPDLSTAGSISIYQFLKYADMPAEIYIDGNMQHGIRNFVNDNFSCSPASEADVYAYIVGRSATFFQAVMNNIYTKLDRTAFIDCYNGRNGCDTTDNNDCH